MKAKDVLLNVVAYFLTATLLFYSSYTGFKHGNKVVALLTFITAIFVLWSAVENYRKISNDIVLDVGNNGLIGMGAP